MSTPVCFIQFSSGKRYSREWLDEHADFAELLLEKEKGKRPRCMCVEGGVEMYISTRHRHILARMPETGPQHAIHCPSYEPDRSFSGRAAYALNAIVENEHGITLVKTSVSIKKQPRTLEDDPESDDDPATNPRGARNSTVRHSLGMRGLMHLVWEKAEINRWAAGMAGKRHYAVVQKRVNDAAAHIFIKQNTSLALCLFFPPQYSSDRAAAIGAQRKEFLDPRFAKNMRVLVMGFIRSVVVADGLVGIRLSNLPNDFIVWIDSEEFMREWSRRLSWVVEDWKTLGREHNVLALCAVERSENGRLQGSKFVTMTTDKNFIPTSGLREREMSSWLVEEGRYFVKSMSYEVGASAAYPDYLLLDAGARPVPLVLMDAPGTGRYEAQKALVEKYLDDNVAFWCWQHEHELTPLPPARAFVGQGKIAARGKNLPADSQRQVAKDSL